MRRTRRRLRGCWDGVRGGCVSAYACARWSNHLPFECFGQAVLVAFNLEDLDRLVGGACC